MRLKVHFGYILFMDSVRDRVEPSFRSGRRKAPKTEVFGWRGGNHLWAGSGGRR